VVVSPLVVWQLLQRPHALMCCVSGIVERYVTEERGVCWCCLIFVLLLTFTNLALRSVTNMKVSAAYEVEVACWMVRTDFSQMDVRRCSSCHFVPKTEAVVYVENGTRDQ
jgi:hypothetical protein